MKRLVVLAFGTALVLGAAGAAEAARLNWVGTGSTTTGNLPPTSLTGGGVATVNGSSGTVPAHLVTLRVAASRGGVEGTVTNLITDPETQGNSIAALVLQLAGGTGTLRPISGAIASNTELTQGVLPVRGISKICILSSLCTDFLPLILTQFTTNGARVGVGIGGLITVGGDSPIRISLEAAPWTVKTVAAIDQTDDNTGAAAFHNVTRQGFAHGPLSNTTSTAAPSGVLQIVTPNQVRTNLPLGSSIKVAILTELLIHFIPEPGLLILLGSGVVGLALIGARRMRK